MPVLHVQEAAQIVVRVHEPWFGHEYVLDAVLIDASANARDEVLHVGVEYSRLHCRKERQHVRLHVRVREIDGGGANQVSERDGVAFLLVIERCQCKEPRRDVLGELAVLEQRATKARLGRAIGSWHEPQAAIVIEIRKRPSDGAEAEEVVVELGERAGQEHIHVYGDVLEHPVDLPQRRRACNVHDGQHLEVVSLLEQAESNELSADAKISTSLDRNHLVVQPADHGTFDFHTIRTMRDDCLDRLWDIRVILCC